MLGTSFDEEFDLSQIVIPLFKASPLPIADLHHKAEQSVPPRANKLPGYSDPKTWPCLDRTTAWTFKYKPATSREPRIIIGPGFQT
jgi:hypothetical protein